MNSANGGTLRPPPLGGDKTGKDRWYEEHVPLADAIYDEHLRELDED